MPNIMINQDCNMHCCYCFANEFVNQEGASNMSLENFKLAVEFSEGERLGIIGGEPTLHPQFGELVDYALASPRENKVLVFTNALKIDELRIRARHKRLGILVNYNGPLACSKAMFDQVSNNIITLCEDGLSSSMTLGINIFSPTMNIDYVVDMSEYVGSGYIRTAVAVPNDEKLRSMPVLDYYSTMKYKLLELVSKAADKNIAIGLDCNKLPSCVFTEKEMQFMAEVSVKLPQSRLMEYPRCSPVTDIQPDLSIVRCFGMSDVLKLHMRDYPTLAEVTDAFNCSVDCVAKTVPTTEACVNCRLFRTGRCSAGCLGYKAAKIRKMMESNPYVRF